MILIGKIPKKHSSAIQFYAEKLFTPQKRRHLKLQVQYRKKMNHQGIVIVEDYNALGVPNHFIIELHLDTEEEMLKTLAHEMIHMLQYAIGELNEEMTCWRGRKVNSDVIPYDEQPWEIEAESKGIKLYEAFLAAKA